MLSGAIIIFIIIIIIIIISGLQQVTNWVVSWVLSPVGCWSVIVVNQRIQYKVLSLTYKTLQSQKHSYLYNLLNLQANTSTRSDVQLLLSSPNNWQIFHLSCPGCLEHST